MMIIRMDNPLLQDFKIRFSFLASAAGGATRRYYADLVFISSPLVIPVTHTFIAFGFDLIFKFQETGTLFGAA